MTDILFYSRKTDYGWLSNFERSPQIIEGIVYQTNEHYYQSQKTIDPNLREWIRNAPTPYAAMMAGRTCIRKKELREFWDEIKFDIMTRGLRAKFTQNITLKQKLIETGDAPLHENSPTDIIWGIVRVTTENDNSTDFPELYCNSEKYKGKDMLGKLLMQIREEIK